MGQNTKIGFAMAKKPRILFVCTGSPERSQIAEGFARFFGGSLIAAESAGTVASEVDPYCQWAMNETGIDISLQSPELLAKKDLNSYDRIIAVGSDRGGEYPSFAGTPSVERWDVPDPVVPGSGPNDLISSFRAVRNQIEIQVKRLLGELLKQG
jgi:arsenate reductase